MKWPAVALPVVLGLSLIVTALGQAPHAAALPKIGILRPGIPLDPYVNFLKQGLHDLGYIEGQTVTIEWRWAHSRPERLPALAAELVRANVDLIIVAGTKATRAAQQATSSIPIVMAAVGDPVASRFVKSLARPGGNITGLTLLQPGLGEKRLLLLKEVVPAAARVAVLRNPDSAGDSEALWRETQRAARSLGVQLRVEEARDLNELTQAFAAMASARTDALLVLPDPMFTTLRGRIADLAAKSRLPAMYEIREFVIAGGLMSYMPSLADQFRRAAVYADKILKGAKPADLPVEQPTKFELTINLRTAKALGLSIPQSVLARADDVIR